MRAKCPDFLALIFDVVVMMSHAVTLICDIVVMTSCVVTSRHSYTHSKQTKNVYRSPTLLTDFGMIAEGNLFP